MIYTIMRNAAAQGLGLIISFVDRLVVVGVLIRIWGPDLYSDWVVILSSVGLLSLGELGLNIYYGNYLQQAWATKNTALFQRIVSIALTCSISVAILLSLAGGLIAWLVGFPSSFGLTNLSLAEATVVLIVMGLAALSRIARGSISQVFRGRQQFALGTIIDLVCSCCAVGATLAAVLLGGGPMIVAALYLACDIIFGWGVMLAALRLRYPDLRLMPAAPRRKELDDIARNLRWLGILQASPVVWLQLPIIMLSQLGSAGAPLVGFVILRTLVNFTRSIGTMMALGSAVEIAAIHHKGRQREATDRVHAAGRLLSVILVVIAAGALVFGRSIVWVWTGNGEFYDPFIMVPLLIGATAAAPSTLLSSHLMFVNQMRPLAIAQLIQITTGLTVAALLIPHYGTIGAAVGICIGEVIGLALFLPVLASREIAGLNYRVYLVNCAAQMLASAIWCAAIGWSVRYFFDRNTLMDILLGAAGWFLVGAMPVLWMALPSWRRDALIMRLTGIVANAARD